MLFNTIEPSYFQFKLAPQKWEYKVTGIDVVSMESHVLKYIGDQGWELVAVMREDGRSIGYFKRPLKEDTDG